MSTAATILTAVEDRIWKDGTTFSTTTEPTEAQALRWLSQEIVWVATLCAEENSELGRTLGEITTINGTITAATQANPGQLTVASHGLTDDDVVLVTDVVGMTELNGKEYTITSVDANNFTIGVDTSGYTAYSSGGEIAKVKYTLSSSIMAPAQTGWVEKTTTRNPIDLCTEDMLVDYTPTDTEEPVYYYMTTDNLVAFLPRCDDDYTVKIPYWDIPTALTATTDTVPFYGIFDEVLKEALVLRIQNRDEYDLGHELNWFGFLKKEATNIIRMRKGLASGVYR